MNWRARHDLCRWLAVAGLLPLAVAATAYGGWVFRLALYPRLRPWDGLLVVAVAALVAAVVWRWRWRVAAVRWLVLGWAAVLLSVVGVREGRHQWQRRAVMSAPAATVAPWGAHLVVGYHDEAEVLTLARRGAIGGVYLGRHNVDLPDGARLRRSLASLQAARRAAGLPPLWVMTDQEGGTVTRLSPPLAAPPPARSLAGMAEAEIVAIATAQAAGLLELGVSLNLAPVVDIDRGLDNPADAYSRIAERAIAADAGEVVRVARAICQGFTAARLGCTLKHFPGLGSVFADTHRAGATVDRASFVADAPVFARVAEGLPGAAIMLSHARVEGLTDGEPCSISPAAVRLLRDSWGFAGPLLTDDFSMFPIAREREVGPATAQALAAGVDLVLFSYDSDLLYPALAHLLARPDLAPPGAARLEALRRALVPAAGD